MRIQRIKQSKDTIINALKTCIWAFGMYFRVSKWLVSIALFAQLITSFHSLIAAYIYGLLINQIVTLVNIGQQTWEPFIPLVIILGIVEIFFGALQLLQSYCQRVLGHKERFVFRRVLFERLKELGIAKLENHEVANKAQRFEETMFDISNIVQMSIGFLGSLLTAGSAVVVMSSRLPIIIPILILLFIIKLLLNQNFMAQLNKLFIESTEPRRSAYDAADMLSVPISLKEVLSIGAFNFLKEKFDAFGYWYIRKLKAIRGQWALVILGTDITSGIVIAWGILKILDRIIKGSETIGSFTFQVVALRNLNDSFENMTYRIGNIRDISLRLTDAKELFTSIETDVDGAVDMPVSKISPQIEIKNMSFRYENSPKDVLNNINLVINPGEKLAIVGVNGAGKSTLVKLLSRLYRPREGGIFVNGVNLNEVKISSWHQKLGVLHQDFNRYEFLTARENIVIGSSNEKINEKKISRVIALANVAGFILSLPNKFDQIMSERYKNGIRPSTGQWQKLALARFFYRNSPVLIFDEPTASIDAHSEAEIFNNIYSFMKKKTVIIISHRFSTVRNADRIIVLHEGRIVEEGSHEELLKKKGKYAKAFKLQAKGYE